MSPLFWLLVPTGTAIAGDDPWIAPQHTTNVYVATLGERFEDFVGASGDTMSIDAPIVSLGGKVYIRHGLGRQMDVSLDVPVARTWSPGSQQTGLYSTTLGVGLMQAELRRQWLGGDVPVGVSSRLAVRSGVLHRGSRGRLTNLGEGSTDVGIGVGVGQISLLGGAFLTMDAGASYWYRFALESGDVPGDEITWSGNVLLTATDKVGVGLATSGLHRLGGQNLGAVSVQDSDNQWAALNAQQIKAGGRLSIYSSSRRPSVSVYFLHSVWARNNPVDTALVEVGLGWDIRRGS